MLLVSDYILSSKVLKGQLKKYPDESHVDLLQRCEILKSCRNIKVTHMSSAFEIINKTKIPCFN